MSDDGEYPVLFSHRGVLQYVLQYVFDPMINNFQIYEHQQNMLMIFTEYKIKIQINCFVLYSDLQISIQYYL